MTNTEQVFPMPLLTKREAMALAIMQAMCSSHDLVCAYRSHAAMADNAIGRADALLAALESGT